MHDAEKTQDFVEIITKKAFVKKIENYWQNARKFKKLLAII